MSKGVRHRMLVIGAGSIGERHLRCFLTTERAEVSFVDIRPDLRAEIEARYPGVKGYATLEAALENDFDCAVVATPAPLHIPQAVTLVERGLHVLIEKPLSTKVEQVDLLIRKLSERRLVGAVAYVYRAHPVLTAMRDAIASGEFGRPVELVVVAGQHFPFYRPAYRQTYYASRDTGGGAVQDALTHLLNAGEWLVGPIDRVVADAAHLVLDGVEVEDTVHVLARQGEVLASYALNQHQAPNETTITMICERGTARFEFHNHRWRSMTEPGGSWKEREDVSLERDSLFTRQAHSFLDAIEGTVPPLCDLPEGLQTLQANLAILRSLERGCWEQMSDEMHSSFNQCNQTNNSRA